MPRLSLALVRCRVTTEWSGHGATNGAGLQVPLARGFRHDVEFIRGYRLAIMENSSCANGSRSHRVLNMATGTHPIFPLRESDISRIARLPNHAQGFFAFDGARQKPGTWMASKTDIRRERKPSPLARITGRTEIQHSDDAGLKSACRVGCAPSLSCTAPGDVPGYHTQLPGPGVNTGLGVDKSATIPSKTARLKINRKNFARTLDR